jgi:peptide/nickel transport system permease protein
MALVLWTRVARLVRAETLRVRQREYVLAAQGLGLSAWRIMLVHILPNTLAPVLVTTAFGLAGAVSIEASLSFLGFGAPESTASWGGLLHGALGNYRAWWLVVTPGAAILILVLAYNLLGEALRDVLDPRHSDTL